jgi:hypothetical protein
VLWSGADAGNTKELLKLVKEPSLVLAHVGFKGRGHELPL